MAYRDLAAKVSRVGQRPRGTVNLPSCRLPIRCRSAWSTWPGLPWSSSSPTYLHTAESLRCRRAKPRNVNHRLARKRPVFDVRPTGSMADSDSAGYSIKLVAGDGAPIGTIARPIGPEPVTTELETTVRDPAMAEFERLYGDPANPQGPDRAPPEFMAQMVARMRADIERMQFNHEIPVVLSLRATWEGGLWVRRRREGDPGDGAVGVIDVWNPDGRYVGTLPPDDPPMPDAFGPDGLAA